MPLVPDPEHLVEHAVRGARLAGPAWLGLTVTDGDPARRRYDALGFREVRRTISVRVPG